MFRPYSRRSRYADFTDWQDYRFHGPMRHRPIPPWGYRRRHPVLRILAILAIFWVVTRLIRGRSASWF